MISAKTNDLPGVNFNVMILSQFSPEIKRKLTIMQKTNSSLHYETLDT